MLRCDPDKSRKCAMDGVWHRTNQMVEFRLEPQMCLMPSQGLFPGISLYVSVTVRHLAFDLREPICTLLYAMPLTQALDYDCARRVKYTSMNTKYATRNKA